MHLDLSVAFEALVHGSPEDAWRARDDETFWTICEDYAEALQALERWRRGDAAREDRAGEFHRIVVELQQELIEYLSRSNQGGNA